MEAALKTCTICGKEKSTDDFYSQNGGLYGRKGSCKECSCLYQRNRNSTKYYKDKRKNNILLKEYNLTLEQFDIMSDSQNHQCKICKGINPDGKRLFVDHDHTTGKVRGLLCKFCNLMLGNARDNQTYLAEAINYLIKSKE